VKYLKITLNGERIQLIAFSAYSVHVIQPSRRIKTWHIYVLYKNNSNIDVRFTVTHISDRYWSVFAINFCKVRSISQFVHLDVKVLWDVNKGIWWSSDSVALLLCKWVRVMTFCFWWRHSRKREIPCQWKLSYL